MNAPTMTEAQFLEELAGLKDAYWWYVDRDDDGIRGERHDTHRTTRACCPITALCWSRDEAYVPNGDAHTLGAAQLGLDHDLACNIVEASDNATITERKALRTAMLKALGLAT